MKLTLSLLFVCATVMVSEARPDEIRRVVDISAIAEGVGENSQGMSDVYEDPVFYGRSGTAFSSADKGISVSQSRINTKEYQTDADTAPVKIEPTASTKTMVA